MCVSFYANRCNDANETVNHIQSVHAHAALRRVLISHMWKHLCGCMVGVINL